MTLLLVPVALLGWQAAEATVSHRATAEGILEDYAAVAADRLSSSLDQAWGEMMYAPVMMMGEAARKPVPWLPTRKDINPDDFPDWRKTWEFIRSFYRWDPEKDDFRVSEEGIDNPEREWVQSVLRPLAGVLDSGGRRLVFAQRSRGRVRPFFVVRFPNADGKPGPIYAVEGRVGVLVGLVGKVASVPLLPAALVAPEDQAGLVRVSVKIPSGRTLLRRGGVEEAAASAVRTTDPAAGQLEVTASVPLSAADDLVIGGLPSSRLPLVLILLAITILLAAAALFLVRREAQLARMRSDFVASVSHELRTPLAQIRMFAETLVLGRVRTSEEARRSLRIIDKEARRLTHQVENVLQFARAERRALQLELEPADLREVMLETLEGFRPLAAARDVTVRTELASTPRVLVDRDAFRRILLNLLDNALKYGPRGQEVSVRLGLAKDFVRIVVEDQGPGIPPKERERVFEKYRRGKGPRHASVGGCGIGLWLVRELVAALSGDVRIGRGTSGGTRVEIDLPADRAGAIASTDPPENGS